MGIIHLSSLGREGSEGQGGVERKAVHRIHVHEQFRNHAFHPKSQLSWWATTEGTHRNAETSRKQRKMRLNPDTQRAPAGLKQGMETLSAGAWQLGEEQST